MMTSIEDLNSVVRNAYTEWVAHYCKFTIFNRLQLSINIKLLNRNSNSAWFANNSLGLRLFAGG